MGAYERLPAALDTDADGLPDSWEWDYSDNPTGMTAAADDDGDGFDNTTERGVGTNPWSTDSDGDTMRDPTEVLIGMDPADPASVFSCYPQRPKNGLCVVQWQSAPGKMYDLWTSTDMTNYTPVATNLPGTPPLNSYTDAVGSAGFHCYQPRVTP